MKRKTFSFLLLSLSLALAACGEGIIVSGSETSGASTTGGSTTSTNNLYTISIPSLGNSSETLISRDYRLQTLVGGGTMQGIASSKLYDLGLTIELP